MTVYASLDREKREFTLVFSDGFPDEDFSIKSAIETMQEAIDIIIGKKKSAFPVERWSHVKLMKSGE